MAAELTPNALVLLKQRYLLKDSKGRVTETPEQMFRRVAKAVSKAEGRDARKFEEKFFGMMSSLEWLPNSPTMFNAGTSLGQLSACFVLPINDSLTSIFDAVKHTALIEQSGGGVGLSFSRVRPEGSMVQSSKGTASGPVSFMRVFDTVTGVINAGGKRRGAMMGVLDVDHPDIMGFIRSKETGNVLSNFNISVAVTDSFMGKARRNRKVWDAIVKAAWKGGDPGLLFIDEINRKNPTRKLGRVESTNPCGEAVLHPYESCNLGSINLTRMVCMKGGKCTIDWDMLRKTVRLAVRFLDDVIDVNKYPMPQIEAITKANRRIGLGVMGFADMLIMLGIPYDSERALKAAGKLMRFITEESHRMSQELARKKGPFRNMGKSSWKRPMRNATTTTIAPTGSISIIAGVSSGIEPLFAVSYVRKVLGGKRMVETNRLFKRIARERGFYSRKLMSEVARKGTVKGVKAVPKDIQRLFVTALEIKPGWHVRMQAAFQKHTDNAVSKTVNFPKSAKVADVEKAFMMAHKLKCKGITAYRYGSKEEQVMCIGCE